MADETDVTVKFGAQTAGVQAGAETVKSSIRDVSAEIERAEELFTYLGERMLEVFALHEITEFIEKTSEIGENIERMTAMTGLSSEKIQTLQYAMKATGGDAEAAGSMITRFERNVEMAAGGSGRAYDAFQKLGLSLRDLQTLSIDQLIEKTAQGFRSLTDPVERAALASEVGSRGFAQMLPAILSSADGIDAFRERLKSLNDDLSDKTVAALAETHRNITDLGIAAQGAAAQGMLTFKGAIDGVLEDFTYAIVDIGKAIGSFRELETVVGYDLVVAFGRLLEAIKDTGAEASLFVNDAIVKYKEWGAVMATLVTHPSRLADIYAEADAEIAANNKTATQSIKQYAAEFDSLEASARKAAQSITAANPAADGESKPPTARRTGLAAPKDDSADLEYEKELINTRLQLAKLGLQGQKDVLDEEVAAHKLTNVQKLADLKDYTTLEYQVSMEALDKEAALYEQDDIEYQKALDRKQILTAQYTNAIAKLSAQAAQAQQKDSQQTYQSWLKAINPIETAFDGMLQGILQGTETIGEAMGNAFANAAVSVIESIAKIIVEWLLFEAVTEGQGTWNDFVAVEGGASSGASLLGKIASFDVGTSYVPSTGLAMIHQGEMIIPATQAQGLRDGTVGSSGDVSVTFNVNAIDTQTGAQFLKNNAAVIAKAVSSQIRNANPSLTGQRLN